ncbi:unnamed protein product, partial [Toxocara canis]|uniref:Histone deacetylase n=1 Tax=Toxocara canis TaxID=6265 RepID=A0A183U663_TOXCA
MNQEFLGLKEMRSHERNTLDAESVRSNLCRRSLANSHQQKGVPDSFEGLALAAFLVRLNGLWQLTSQGRRICQRQEFRSTANVASHITTTLFKKRLVGFGLDGQSITQMSLANVGNYYYGQGHVMKPHRIRMTHHLLLNYGIYRNLEVYRPFPATFEDMTRFHSNDYMMFLRTANPDN